MRKFFPNIMVVCGSGRKVGKTTIVRELISFFKENQKIAAIKVSPHFYQDKQPQNIIMHDINCNVYIENESDSYRINKKDSSLFFQAGASPVYYIETKDDKLENAFLFILKHIGDQRLIICESGILGRLFKPGILIYLESTIKKVENNDKVTNKNLADVIIQINENNLQAEVLKAIKKIRVVENKWELC